MTVPREQRMGHSYLAIAVVNATPRPRSRVVVPFTNPNAPETDMLVLFGAIAQIKTSTVVKVVLSKK